jgi:Xaa-Pro aminopeptidase
MVKGRMMNEYEGTVRLEEFRKKQELFVDLSFPTILGVGANGAVIHYRPTAEECGVLDPSKLMLLDSGGHYMDGTTDVTRTFHFGEPSKEEVRAFTLVLRGHIAIDRVMFPKGTTGGRLDILARQFLWREGHDYKHGTGHGVGHFLNVHEGPQRISPRADTVALRAGMTLSNEPGYYKEGSFGVRLEDVMAVRDAVGHEDFYGMENLTRVRHIDSWFDRDIYGIGAVPVEDD